MNRRSERSLAVLLLAYHFPPVGGAGVQRSAKFTRYLPGEGVRPIVLTGPERSSAGRWTTRDASLGRDVPDDTIVLRIRDAEPPEPNRLAGLAERWLAWPARFSRWWVESCAREGETAIREYAPEVICASMQPYETAFAAARLARRSGLPWVADLRDPWALDEVMSYPTRWHRSFELRRMHRALRSASAIVMNTPESRAALLRAFPRLPSERVHAITNGYDAADFAGAPPDPDDDRFCIAHTGYLHTELGELQLQRKDNPLRRFLGGERPGMNLLSRSHHYLLQAVERWLESDPGIARRVRLVFAGVTSRGDRRRVENSPARTLVEMPGYLEHADSVSLLRRADLLFLPMHDLAAGERASIVPGKTYEYLATGRPILAAVPEGDARDFLVRSGRARLVAPTDVDAMLAVLRDEYERFAKFGHCPPGTLDEPTLGFERRELTRKFAAVLREAAATRA